MYVKSYFIIGGYITMRSIAGAILLCTGVIAILAVRLTKVIVQVFNRTNFIGEAPYQKLTISGYAGFLIISGILLILIDLKFYNVIRKAFFFINHKLDMLPKNNYRNIGLLILLFTIAGYLSILLNRVTILLSSLAIVMLLIGIISSFILIIIGNRKKRT